MAEYCPVCGFDLGFPCWDQNKPSYEICRACGIHFGVDDACSSIPTLSDREKVYREWRESWIASGMKWFSRNPPPPDWDPRRQLEMIGAIPKKKGEDKEK